LMMKLALSTLVAIAITLPLAVGCAPAMPTDQLCGQLIDCYGGSLTLEQKTQAAEVCPTAMSILLIAGPDCYACLAEAGCEADSTCGDACKQTLYQYFPELNPE
jgi:hypothetical protein